MLKKLSLVVFIGLILSGCSFTLHPQRFYSDEFDPSKKAIIVNNYINKDFYYVITSINGEKLGDAWYGTTRITEVHVPNGNQKIGVAGNFVPNNYFEVALNTGYKGVINCDLAAGGFYIIGPDKHGSAVRSVGVSLGTPSGTLYTTPVQGMHMGCEKLDQLPVNIPLIEMSKKYGREISTEYYEPNK